MQTKPAGNRAGGNEHNSLRIRLFLIEIFRHLNEFGKNRIRDIIIRNIVNIFSVLILEAVEAGLSYVMFSISFI